MKGFDLLRTPLSGRNLIEASAGTGKTYAIAGLFVRLIVEEGLTVDRILVVTFTEAATGELRDRIRSRIREALDGFRLGTSEDPLIAGLLERVGDRKGAVDGLTLALHSFDEAAIHTIHGFCRRTLGEMAFESGSLFDTELTKDSIGLVQGLVDDFWRQRMIGADAAFVKWARTSRLTTGDLVKLAARWARRPGLTILPDCMAPDIKGPVSVYEVALKRARDEFEVSRDEVLDLLSNDPGINRSRYRPASVRKWVDSMEAFLLDPLPLKAFDGFERFRPSTIASAMKSGATAPTHRFFDICDELHEALVAVREALSFGEAALKRDLLIYVADGFPELKKALNTRTFDDLLLDLDRALAGDSGPALAEALRDRHPVALIDEFQDTDPVQFSIFERIYGSGDATLFFIGDPKQAIFGFRGADVFAYMAAKVGVPEGTKWTLRTNWRSVEGLIESVNSVFGSTTKPFVFEEIGFDPAVAAEIEDRDVLMLDGKPDDREFQLWMVPPSGDKPVNINEAGQRIRAAVAGEIVRLLNRSREGRAAIAGRSDPAGGRPLEAGDIAVLVRTNEQARAMQRELRFLGVPTVLHSDISLFDSEEAVDLMRILAAVADPDDTGAVRAALVTDVIGMTASELSDCIEDEGSWAGRADRFRRYRDLWTRRSFMAMAMDMMSRERIREGLLSFDDGDRRLTNVLHCLDVLHRASVDGKLGVDGLIKWFGRRMATHDATDEYQVRLETDEKAVRLVTIHKSKGLEYPITFVPFSWGASRLRNGEPLAFHPHEDDSRMVLDMTPGGSSEHEMKALNETVAEDLRLLYVSLTRARHRCYVVWGALKGAKESALGRLMPERTEELESRSGNHVLVSEIPGPTVERYEPASPVRGELGAREFHGKVSRDWKVTSFSRIAARVAHDPEDPDYDAVRRPEAVTGPESSVGGAGSIMDFPAGARAGTCLHEVFERVDFGNPDPDQVGEVLSRHGFDVEWTDPVTEMVTTVLDAEILDGFKLSMLGCTDRLHEMEFAFPVGLLDVESLRGAVPDHAEALRRLEFQPHRGLMKGFVDLVFRVNQRYYLLDWKSNHLGFEPDDYAPKRLSRVMDRDLYVLQSRLYSIALHRHLKSRLAGYDYDSMFGGVLYLFLRGVPFGGGRGIWFERPEPIDIEGLDAFFAGGGGRA